jgi:HPt (histidine-containing phosphotransfer) domain-containing protein
MIIDTTEVMDRCGDDRELLAELVGLFLDDVPGLMSDIRQAITEGRASALAHAAHTLKGAVGNFSAQPAFEAARCLEVAGRNGDLEDAPQMLIQLEVELERLEPALRSLVAV